MYDVVVVAGTFDRLHAGHESLIKRACAMARKKLYIGITSDDYIINRKLLWELIEPFETRKYSLQNFIRDAEILNPEIELIILPIDDKYGFIFDIKCDCIIVSRETFENAKLLNAGYVERGWAPMHIEIVEYKLNSEDIICSSAKRWSKLGSLLTPGKNLNCKNLISIGLTGPICSGKSTICNYLAASYDVAIIKLDELGHQAYLPNSNCYEAVVERFGNEILKNDTDKTIDREKLGNIVFENEQNLKDLEAIVLPEMKAMKDSLVKKIFEDHQQSNLHAGKKIIVTEGATILKSNSTNDYDEIWCCILSNCKIVERMKGSRTVDEEKTRKILSKNLSTKEFVQRSNVVFSSEKSIEDLLRQVDCTMARLLS